MSRSKRLSSAIGAKRDLEIFPLPKTESCAIFCPVNEDRFNQLAGEMKEGDWELVTAVPHKRYVNNNGNCGVSDGWMTFWKRADINHEE